MDSSISHYYAGLPLPRSLSQPEHEQRFLEK